MPNILAEEMRKRLIAKCKLRACTLCGETAWTVDPAITILDKSPNIIAGNNYQNFCGAAICDNCGNTHLIHLHKLGFSNSEILSIEFEGIN